MKAIRFGWIRKSIFAKFSLSFISAGLIPLLVISFFALNTFGNYMERYTVNNVEQMMLFASKNVDDMYQKYNNISKLMYSYGVQGKYGQLGEAIADQVTTGDVRLTGTVEDFLKTILYTDYHISNTVFVFPGGEYQDLSKVNKRIDFRYPYPEESWKKQLQDTPQELAFFPTHAESYYQLPDGPVFTFGRNLIDVLGSYQLEWNVVGSLYFDVSISAFDEIFQQLKLNEQDAVYVTDAKGNILYSNHRDMIGKVYQAASSEEYLYVNKDMQQAGWQVTGEVYKEEMFSRINQIKSTIALVVGLCILSLVIVAVWFSNSLSNPIRSIMKQMTKVESGNFNNQVEVRSRDEIGMLARGFNRMNQRLQSYIDEVYVAQIKQKQAELHALKSQIRPHYLYNTLEVIRMSAVANDDEEVGDMIMSLSHQLKYVLDYGEEIVKLQDEKTNIEQYFRLMELRYGEHRLAMDIRMDGEVLDCPVPKLSIQPLVENAIYHGIMPKTGKGTIRITAEKDESDRLVITVDDDGVGMASSKLEELRSRLSGRSVPGGGSGGIGLKNVHDRIVAQYGPEFGVEVSSSPHIGTSIRMAIPYWKEAGSHDQRHSG
jgi:two-component system, sensor histidine kinase YesM